MTDDHPALAPLTALHHPIPIYPADCQADEDWDEHESDPAEGFCRDCPPEFHACETCCDEDGSWIEWPCQTGTAIAEARALLGEVSVTEEVIEDPRNEGHYARRITVTAHVTDWTEVES